QASLRLLGSHVGRGADNLSLDGQACILGLTPWNRGGVGCLFLRLIHELGEPPVEEDDLAEVAEHHVLAFKVAMENPVGMSIGNGIANGGEGREQRQDRKSTRLNSSHVAISYDVRRLKK